MPPNFVSRFAINSYYVSFPLGFGFIAPSYGGPDRIWTGGNQGITKKADERSRLYDEHSENKHSESDSLQN